MRSSYSVLETYVHLNADESLVVYAFTDNIILYASAQTQPKHTSIIYNLPKIPNILQLKTRLENRLHTIK